LLEDNNLICKLLFQSINLNYLLAASFFLSDYEIAEFFIGRKLFLLYFYKVVDKEIIDIHHGLFLQDFLT